MKLLLLPGMDGTGELFGRFAAEVSSWSTPTVVRYPNEPRSPGELADQIELTEPVTVLAESFSGAVGIRLAAKHPALVTKLILVGSFVTPPRGSSAMRMLGSLPFHVSPPRWVLRRWLIGADASDELVSQLASTLRQVAPAVLAHRLASISRIDERASLQSLTVPIITLTARQDRLVSTRLRSHLTAAKHLELDGPHLLLQARPREAAELLRHHLS